MDTPVVTTGMALLLCREFEPGVAMLLGQTWAEMDKAHTAARDGGMLTRLITEDYENQRRRAVATRADPARSSDPPQYYRASVFAELMFLTEVGGCVGARVGFGVRVKQ
jgi:hypothetical protein